MVVNEKYKFIFVHVYRTGGTSIDWAFDQKHRHDTHQKLETHPNWQDYFSFAFVRNPWDRMVSSYHYMKRSKRHTKSFDQHIMDDVAKPKDKRFAQYCMVENCTYVGRFEHLQTDFNEICDLIGMPRKQLPHIWKTQHKPYAEYYNDKLIAAVANHQSGDIEHFGFDFNSTATKNIGLLK